MKGILTLVKDKRPRNAVLNDRIRDDSDSRVVHHPAMQFVIVQANGAIRTGTREEDGFVVVGNLVFFALQEVPLRRRLSIDELPSFTIWSH